VLQCARKDRNEAVLMMLHANGYGVPRDVNAAIAHACQVGGAQAEIESRLEHLEQLKAGPEKEPFDLCDDITSGMMGGFCASLAEDRATAQREAALRELVRGFTPEQRQRFDALRQAGEAYGRQRGEEETDLTGTLRVAFTIEAQAAVRDELLADLRAAERGTKPPGNERTLAAADKELNAVYRKVMAVPVNAEGRIGDSTVTRAGIRSTQRQWLVYRDAWVAFARARYPAVPADAWLTRLTQRRTALLREWLRK
jgi:uncharacterized protein YecT (DUF1311 family)